jgi:hypothetical protein
MGAICNACWEGQGRQLCVRVYLVRELRGRSQPPCCGWWRKHGQPRVRQLAVGGFWLWIQKMIE